MNNKKQIFRKLSLVSLILFVSSLCTKDSEAMQSKSRNRTGNIYENIDNQKPNNFVKYKKCNEITCRGTEGNIVHISEYKSHFLIVDDASFTNLGNWTFSITDENVNNFASAKKYLSKSFGCRDFYWYKHGDFNVLVGIKLLKMDNSNFEYSYLYFYFFDHQPSARLDAIRIENKIKNNLEKFGDSRISRLFKRALIIENPKYSCNTKPVDKINMYKKKSQINVNFNESVFTFAKKINYKGSNISPQFSKTKINSNNSQKDTSLSLRIPSNYDVDMSYSHSDNDLISSSSNESISFSLDSDINKNKGETTPSEYHPSSSSMKIKMDNVLVKPSTKYVTSVSVSEYDNRNASTNPTVYEDDKKARLYSGKNLKYGNHLFKYSGYNEDNNYFYIYYYYSSNTNTKCTLYLDKASLKNSFFENSFPNGKSFRYQYDGDILTHNKDEYIYRFLKEDSDVYGPEVQKTFNEVQSIIEAFKECIDQFGISLHYKILAEERESEGDPYGVS